MCKREGEKAYSIYRKLHINRAVLVNSTMVFLIAIVSKLCTRNVDLASQWSSQWQEQQKYFVVVFYSHIQRIVLATEENCGDTTSQP